MLTLTIRDRGQATAEYCLMTMAAGLIAIGVVVLVRHGGGLNALFQHVIDSLTSKV
jgi:hypothetical protein